MKIDIVISDSFNPMFHGLHKWTEFHPEHDAKLISTLGDCRGGDLLVLAACHEIADISTRMKYSRCVVTHASDLPKGRGWSPYIWDILNGEGRIVMSVIEAVDMVDAGRIFAKFKTDVSKTDTYREISTKLSQLAWKALDFVTENFYMLDTFMEPQVGKPTYYPRRQPQDSEIDPYKTIAEQFDLLRVCDNYRYPSFFVLHNQKFKISVQKA